MHVVTKGKALFTYSHRASSNRSVNNVVNIPCLFKYKFFNQSIGVLFLWYGHCY